MPSNSFRLETYRLAAGKSVMHLVDFQQHPVTVSGWMLRTVALQV